jgi:hypothetical protein
MGKKYASLQRLTAELMVEPFGAPPSFRPYKEHPYNKLRALKEATARLHIVLKANKRQGIQIGGLIRVSEAKYRWLVTLLPCN